VAWDWNWSVVALLGMVNAGEVRLVVVRVGANVMAGNWAVRKCGGEGVRYVVSVVKVVVVRVGVALP